MKSTRRRTSDPRRMTFLNLSSQIEGQLREAYDCEFKAGRETQSSLARKLGVGRSAIHRRLSGHTNMTAESIADMVWALNRAIKLEIYDPLNGCTANYHFMAASTAKQATAIPPVSSATPEPATALNQQTSLHPLTEFFGMGKNNVLLPEEAVLS